MEVRKRIGYLPETPPLYPDMSVGDYLAFVARIKGVPAGDIGRRLEEAMRMANILDKRYELIKRLSRGYKQRVGIAQAIVHNPDVVILDEPTVGLDPNQIKEVRHLIKGLAGEHTIILSTHILPEVEMTCDRVVIINKGRIVAVDTTENLTTQLKGGERVQVKIRGSQETIRKTLEKIEAVKHVELSPSDDSDVIGATIESEQGTDLRPQIAARVVGSGLDLLELRAVKLSLEDIFMQLTTEEKSVVDAGARPEIRESEPPTEDKSLTEVASADA
jgi:ABC-2 type transport system ATP-binding protein